MAIALLYVLSFAVLNDWTEFRGSKADSHASGPATPMEWSDTKNVVWKTQVPGLGWSSPVIADKVLYLTTAVSDEKSLSLRALATTQRLENFYGNARFEKWMVYRQSTRRTVMQVQRLLFAMEPFMFTLVPWVWPS